MANQLKMDKVQAIRALKQQGWSNRKIAEELGIHRTTVAGKAEGESGTGSLFKLSEPVPLSVLSRFPSQKGHTSGGCENSPFNFLGLHQKLWVNSQAI